MNISLLSDNCECRPCKSFLQKPKITKQIGTESEESKSTLDSSISSIIFWNQLCTGRHCTFNNHISYWPCQLTHPGLI